MIYYGKYVLYIKGEIMADNKNNASEYPEEEMSVEIELEDGRNVICDVVTILEVAGNEYVVLQPQGQDATKPEQEVWFYRYKEDPNDPNVEPELSYIDDDDEYELVLDSFEEYLDSQYFDEL